MFGGFSINEQPKYQPDKSNSSRENEGQLPPVVDRYIRNNQWSGDGADIRSAVKIARFTQSKKKTRGTETHCRTSECMAHGRNRPKDNCERESLSRSETIHQT